MVGAGLRRLEVGEWALDINVLVSGFQPLTSRIRPFSWFLASMLAVQYYHRAASCLPNQGG